MMTIELNITTFRQNFSNYSDDTTYPDSLLLFQYEIGKCYVTDNDCTMPETCREHALQLILAHLLYIRDLINSGGNIGTITSASEGDVSVSLSEPPTSSNWEYWLNASPYGKELLALLSVQSTGGFYVGGLPERRGFRKIGGVF
jgi:hypothetical protein